MKPCSAWQLYVILDRASLGSRDLVAIAAAAIHGGADVLQLRDKTSSTRHLIAEAARLLALTSAAGVPLLINDRADVARAAGADGVHVGQDDLSIKDARAILRQGKLIGQSTHSLEQALAAVREGADYIGCGPIFPTPTKSGAGSVGLGLIRQVGSVVQVPVVCIGGIDAGNIRRVVEAGAQCVAVVRAVCHAVDAEIATRRLKAMIGQTLFKQGALQ